MTRILSRSLNFCLSRSYYSAKGNKCLVVENNIGLSIIHLYAIYIYKCIYMCIRISLALASQCVAQAVLVIFVCRIVAMLMEIS